MAVGAVALAAMIPATSTAQGRGEAPLAPASAIGPTTAAPTISVLGMASSSNGGGSPLTQRGEYWLGATQPLGRFGNVRFNAIGHADVHSGDASGTNSAGEGMLALRARARFSGAQVWSAFSYGYVKSNGQFAPPNVNMGPAIGTGFDGVHVDTTVSQYVDVGSIQRAEAGVISNLSGVEFSFGLALDRISRVTERTLKFEESSQIPPTSMSATDGRTTVLRSLQRREIATGIASMGFYTGPATWLISVTSPLATRITSDASAPKARIAPTVASVAIMQPVTGWLSIVAAGATNSSSVGSTVFRDDVGATRHANFAPVVALGVRIARLPFFGRGDDTPSGILSFESRIIGSVDSASVNQVDSASTEGAQRDTLRVVLWIDAPKAESVELMGDATQWTVLGMSRNRSGRWRAELKLAPGVHRITVRTDGGKWIAPPSLPIGNDDYGAPVGMIIVRGDR